MPCWDPVGLPAYSAGILRLLTSRSFSAILSQALWLGGWLNFKRGAQPGKPPKLLPCTPHRLWPVPRGPPGRCGHHRKPQSPPWSSTCPAAACHRGRRWWSAFEAALPHSFKIQASTSWKSRICAKSLETNALSFIQGGLTGRRQTSLALASMHANRPSAPAGRQSPRAQPTAGSPGAGPKALHWAAPRLKCDGPNGQRL